MTATPLSAADLRHVNRKLYIDGQWVDASDGAEFPVIDPATEEQLTTVSSGTPDDALAAVAAAQAALPAWAARPPRERAEILRRAYGLMVERFAGGLARAMAALKVGPGLDDGVQLGPLVNASTRDKVASLVADAVTRGAKAMTGGHIPQRPGYYYEPTVLTDVARDSHCLREEIFGPVAPIVAFDDVADAVAQANDTEYGLAAYLYTGDLATGLRVSESLEYGMIGLNRGLISDPAAPFGGVKQSGLGREGAHDGLLEFLETKYIATSW